MGAEVASWVVERKDTIDELHSLGSCVSLTRGAAFPGLVGAVCRVLDTHLDRYRKLVRRLDKKKVIVDEDWSVLQHCLTANTCTGELLLMLEQLEVSLAR